MKTREDIEKLKQSWAKDPSWDIETTEGFEEYKDELLEFRKLKEQEWKTARQQEHDRLTSLLCPLAFSGRWNCKASHGKCRNCNLERDFVNVIPEVSRTGISFIDPATNKARHDYLFFESLTWLEVPDRDMVLKYDRIRR